MALDKFGGAFGGIFGGSLNQQQMSAQQLFANAYIDNNNAWENSTITTTANTSDKINYKMWAGLGYSDPKPAPESWLDQRVNEITSIGKELLG